MRRFFPIVALVSLAGVIFAQSPIRSATPDPELAKQLAVMPVEDLISSLQQESKAGLGTDPMARCDPGDAKFQGGEFSSKHQEVSPVMHELITRGIHALPALIDHIMDARPTKATVYESLADDFFPTCLDVNLAGKFLSSKKFRFSAPQPASRSVRYWSRFTPERSSGVDLRGKFFLCRIPRFVP